MGTMEKISASWTYVLDEPVRILVVDDDPILREFASVYLSSPSVTIDTAGDGAAARALLDQAVYDIIILDIEMPRVDGFTLLAEIRSNDRLQHLPVIMLTGHDDITSIDRAYQLGANSFATKPVNWRQLSYQVRYVIRTSRLDVPQADSHDLRREPGLTRPAAADRDVRDFLQSVIHRADALIAQSAIRDHGQCRKLLQGIHSLAKAAFAECFGREPSPAFDGVDCTEVADQRNAATDNKSLPDRRSANAMALRL